MAKVLYNITSEAGCGSVWLERTAGGREVAGSNPVTPIRVAVHKSTAFLMLNMLFGIDHFWRKIMPISHLLKKVVFICKKSYNIGQVI